VEVVVVVSSGSVDVTSDIVDVDDVSDVLAVDDDGIGIVDVVDEDGVDIVVVSGNVAGVSGFDDAKTTKCNTSERITAKTAKMTKEMQMILTQRRCHHLRGPIFSGTYSL
jgi:hypothetical protein